MLPGARLRAVSIVAVAAGLACRTAEPSPRADARAVREVVEESARRFDLHDADAWLAVFAPDAVLVNVRGRRWELPGDRDAVREVFRTALSEASMELLEVEVRLLRPDVALAHVAMRVGPFVEPGGGRRSAEQQLALLVLTEERGRWVVRAFHNTSVAAPAPAR